MRLKYWARSGFSTLLSVLIASAVYFSLMAIQMDDGWMGYSILLPIYLLLFGALMLMAMSIGLYNQNVSLALSFGSTRNEILVGLQVFRLIPTVGITAILALLTALAGETAMLPLSALIPSALGLFFFTSAIGALIGIANTRWGRVAAIVTGVVVFLVSIGVGILTAFTLSENRLQALLDLGGIGWAVFGVGLMVYSLAMIPEHRTVWKYNVKL